jgi:hypothetical protein
LFPRLSDADYLVVVDDSSLVTSPHDGSYSLASATDPTYDEDDGTTNLHGMMAVTLCAGS